MPFSLFACFSSRNVKTLHSDDEPAQSKSAPTTTKVCPQNLFVQSFPLNLNPAKPRTSSSTAPPVAHKKPQAAAPAAAKSQPAAASSQIKVEAYSADRAATLFKKYADEDEPNTIGPEGFEQLCTDAQIPLEGAGPLILAWQLNAKEMAKIGREEWTKGCEGFRCVFFRTKLAPTEVLLLGSRHSRSCVSS
ncbi:hypothetical protein FB45DRAFT_493583 [Roridomyces roridus]|uniref:Defective in cullin neddylation protein n=1 Tax=Roridomyces roridus TaxID=1738132 RepID=A0AAD7FPH8_9AGAR|nr:hypothetical protein FB45DRAFT_493583 [Roridomyces roridus]